MMKMRLLPRLISSAVLLWLAATAAASDGRPEKHEFAYADTVRTYSIYLPEDLRPDAPLVVYTHGYGSARRWLNDLNATAERHGFAVCYPDGSPDSRGKDGWKVGYPPQESMSVDEADFFRCLINEVTSRFRLSRDNVFMAGMSNGGDLCYQLAFTAPELFKAYASVAGLAFEWLCKNHRLSLPVHFLEIHGNADRTSRWEGNLTNDGGWGCYIAVPEAIGMIAGNNGCRKVTTDSLCSMRDPQRLITRTVHSGAPSGREVVLYEIHGGKHSWADKDLPTAEIIWNFFSSRLTGAMKPGGR